MRTQKNQDNSMGNFIKNMVSKWYVFLISVVVFLLLSFLYLQVAIPDYEITGGLMLKDEKTQAESKTVATFANDNGLSFLLNPSENVSNETRILTSRKLMKEVVHDLGLNIVVGQRSGLRIKEVYDLAPFDVQMVDVHTDSIKERNFEIEWISEKDFRLTDDDEEINKAGTLGQPVATKQYDLLLKPNGPIHKGAKYEVNIVSEDAATRKLMSELTVELTEKGATTLNLDFFYPNPKRGELILQTLMNRYMENNRLEKIRRADSTLGYIDQRLAVVASELDQVEQDLAAFRSRNRITDISEQSKLLVGNANDYYNKLKDQQVQLQIVKDLEGYIKNGQNQRIPSSLNIQNASFGSSLERYNTLMQEYEKKKLSLTDSNPILKNLEEQIKGERSNLLQSIGSYRRELQLTSKEVGALNAGFNNQISSVPAKEKQFVNYSRQQALKQQLYVYLLQKREEATIAKTANSQSASIVDPAKSSGGPVKPKPIIIYFMGMLLGLILPFGYININELLRSRLKSDTDIEYLTDIEILGKIGHNPNSEALAISSHKPNTLIAEGFRSLRANLYYALQSNKSNVVMLTSSIKGEGKTFLSWNLGNALSMTGKKVAFVELDMRKPKLASMMGVQERTPGLSDYIEKGLSLDEIIQANEYNANSFLISAGSYSETPSELLHSDRIAQLFEELKQRFDFIIVDSPPVGLVSDAMIIQPHVDMTIFVCRHNYTRKEQFKFINELKSKNKLAEMYLVINDVDFSRSDYFGYGYGYGYGVEMEDKGWKWGRRK